ncbi:MAG: NAD-dependent epimerase/dehydratase family protein, partial [Deltaproteobacteria bacterium]|nr:NAD-dependent epimerase/dehydratase family protein [Deltaproteobacteria bacterium]
GVEPLTPIRPLSVRVKQWQKVTGKVIKTFIGDIAENHRFVYETMDRFQPEAVVHYAEQPSAPFSMMDREKCLKTQRNNVLGTLNLMFSIQHTNPDIHIVKLGTMGEYGTPKIDIEEGWLEIEYKGRRDRVLYPKKPGSFYHLSKVHDSANLEFGCRVWGLRVTDLNQGVVYGIETDETRLHQDFCTSFHYDAVFGTVLNRFVVQAVHGSPLTIYGKGGQTRGFLNIRDTLQCVELALTHPAERGEFRVFNQFTERFSISELADKVQQAALEIGINVEINRIPNPRVEEEDHYYNPVHSALPALGLKPHYLDSKTIVEMMKMVQSNIDRVDSDVLMPEVKWKQR